MKLKKSLLIACLAIVVTILITATPAIFTFANAADAANAGTANFSWLPNTESDLAGYRIHYGINSEHFDMVVNIGNPSLVDGRIHGSVAGLSAGITYYFVATAYNQSGLESNFSDIATYTCDATIPDDITAPPSGLRIIAIE